MSKTDKTDKNIKSENSELFLSEESSKDSLNLNPSNLSTNKLAKSKLNYLQTILIGFGFLASSLAWSIYNSQVPLILENRFFLSGTAIGSIMTIDNFFGVIFQPIIGSWSDNTRTSIGRRMPWIAFGLPVCAILYAFIPLQNTLWLFMLIIILFNLIMSLWRSPVIALMPDVTIKKHRSQANGIINMMGGIGAILAFFFGGLLAKLSEDKFYPFLFASIVMLISLAILLIFIREPDSISYKEENNLEIKNSLANKWAIDAREALNFEDNHSRVPNSKLNSKAMPKASTDKSKNKALVPFLDLSKFEKFNLMLILLAILFWFMGFNAIETFFTLFATKNFNISDGDATMMLTGFSLAFLVFAIPAGLLGRKIGQRKTIIIGLIGIIVLFIPILFNPEIVLVRILLVGGGIFWAFININSLPLVLESSKTETVGSFTGYYYLFSFTAAILSPILFGFIKDIVGNYGPLFIYSIVFFALALLAIFLMKPNNKQNL